MPDKTVIRDYMVAECIRLIDALTKCENDDFQAINNNAVLHTNLFPTLSPSLFIATVSL